jgi:hypothetical protein
MRCCLGIQYFRTWSRCGASAPTTACRQQGRRYAPTRTARLSATAAKSRGHGRLMSSRACRTAQMTAAAITRVRQSGLAGGRRSPERWLVPSRPWFKDRDYLVKVFHTGTTGVWSWKWETLFFIAGRLGLGWVKGGRFALSRVSRARAGPAIGARKTLGEEYTVHCANPIWAVP